LNLFHGPRVGWNSFSEPYDVGPQWLAAGRMVCTAQGLMPPFEHLVFVLRTAHLGQFSVQMEHALTAGLFVQIVHILSDDLHAELLLQIGQIPMCGIGQHMPQLFPSAVVEGMDPFRIPLPGSRCGHLFDRLAFPQSTLTAKSPQTALGTDACAGEYRKMERGRHELKIRVTELGATLLQIAGFFRLLLTPDLQPPMEIRIDNWKDLQEQLFRDTWDGQIDRHRSSYVYRGLNSVDHVLETSLQRLKGPYPRLERHLLRNFRKYAHLDASPGQSTWNWLALAQHHGLPTRLMDWTYSPYVALHFATNDLERYEEDGLIWGINYVRLNEHLPEALKKVIRDEESNVFTADLLEKVCRTLDELGDLEENPFLLFLEPPSLDARIVNQYALFSMLSRADMKLGAWLEGRAHEVFRIRIPAELKWEIRDKLDQANITERVLLPGLSGLSQWLKRHYSSRGDRS